MSVFLQIIQAQALKLRRTHVLWLAVGAPLACCVIFALLVLAFNPDGEWLTNTAVAINFWGILLLPLYVTLLTALINGVDHQARALKHLYALPLPRWATYAANLGSAAVLVAFSSLLLAGGLLLDIHLLNAAGYGSGEALSLPVEAVFEWSAKAFGGILFALVIQHGLSFQWDSFTWPVGIGIGATIFATQVSQSAYWAALPWGYSVVATSASDLVVRDWALWAGVAGATVAALALGWLASRRDVKA